MADPGVEVCLRSRVTDEARRMLVCMTVFAVQGLWNDKIRTRKVSRCVPRTEMLTSKKSHASHYQRNHECPKLGSLSKDRFGLLLCMNL